MAWYREPRRHALSAKGVKTAINNKPSIGKCQFCGKPTRDLYCSYKCKDEDDAKSAATETENYNVSLSDDGTLDTVIIVNGQELRYDQEFASQFRNKKTGDFTKKGWEELKKIAIEDYEDIYSPTTKIPSLSRNSGLGFEPDYPSE